MQNVKYFKLVKFQLSFEEQKPVNFPTVYLKRKIIYNLILNVI